MRESGRERGRGREKEERGRAQETLVPRKKREREPSHLAGRMGIGSVDELVAMRHDKVEPPVSPLAFHPERERAHARARAARAHAALDEGS